MLRIWRPFLRILSTSGQTAARMVLQSGAVTTSSWPSARYFTCDIHPLTQQCFVHTQGERCIRSAIFSSTPASPNRRTRSVAIPGLYTMAGSSRRNFVDRANSGNKLKERLYVPLKYHAEGQRWQIGSRTMPLQVPIGSVTFFLFSRSSGQPDVQLLSKESWKLPDWLYCL